ncbi:MAG: RidA family protein [Pirellulaceae bacterium]|nr:RidA family protein [Pirellulaceae bacterium]MDP6722874.1 RidA family protein [Pirellulaceae bacterium]
MSRHANRRIFLRDTLLFSTGIVGGTVLASTWSSLVDATQNKVFAKQDDKTSAEDRLHELGIELPPAPQPVAVYLPAVRHGNTLYASGHGPRRANGELIQGKVGADLTLDQGYDAARVVGLNLLSTVRSTLGSLDKVVRLVKVLGMVNCTADFTKQPQVINGCSELMVQVFGENYGKGARSAVGMGSLPSNIAVEIEAIFEVRG